MHVLIFILAIMGLCANRLVSDHSAACCRIDERNAQQIPPRQYHVGAPSYPRTTPVATPGQPHTGRAVATMPGSRLDGGEEQRNGNQGTPCCGIARRPRVH
jgi:hypothetical protein